jgi:hypothetical protein
LCLANITGFIDDRIGTSSGTTIITNHVNISYFHGYTLGPPKPGGFQPKIPTPRATPVVDIITSVSVPSLVGSQRRRNRAA